MSENPVLRHLSSEQMQEMLDGQLPPGEAARLQEHLAACPRCRGELEAWEALFSQLGDLEALEPGPAFAREVLGRVPVREPLPARIRRWWGAAAAAERHLTPEGIQDYLDGRVQGRRAQPVAGHLAACGPCRTEVRGWELFFRELEALGRLAPAPGFQERVLASVRVPLPAPRPAVSSLPARALGWAALLLPSTRRGWAVAGGVAFTPTATLVALTYLVFSNPVLTGGALATYLSWKVSGFLSALLATVAGGVVESAVLFRAYTLLESLPGSPFVFGAGGLLFTLLSAGALWVLYRNMVSPPSANGRHAHAPI